MTLNVLVCGICLVALIGQEMKCNDEAMISATLAIETLIGEWLPWDIEFNESCVAEGCPALKNLSYCPSELDVNALRNITKILSECMSGPICGIVIDRRPIKNMVLSMDDFLPGSKVKGIIRIPTGTGFFSNISTIHLETVNESQHFPIEIIMFIPNARVHGRYEVDFRVQTGVGLDLTASLTQATCDITIQFISNVLINQTGTNVDLTFVNPIIKPIPQLCGIDFPPGFPDILALFTESVRAVYDNSIMATSIVQFMRKLYRNAIQVTFNNCKSSNVTL